MMWIQHYLGRSQRQGQPEPPPVTPILGSLSLTSYLQGNAAKCCKNHADCHCRIFVTVVVCGCGWLLAATGAIWCHTWLEWRSQAPLLSTVPALGRVITSTSTTKLTDKLGRNHQNMGHSFSTYKKHSAFCTTFTIFTSKVENMGKNG